MSEQATKTRQADYMYGEQHAEWLTHDDPWEAAVEFFDHLDAEALPEAVFEAYEYRRKEVDEKHLRWCVSNLIEQLSDDWSEEYGGPDGECGIEADEAELLELVRKWAKRSSIWQCDSTGRVIGFIWDAEKEEPMLSYDRGQ